MFHKKYAMGKGNIYLLNGDSVVKREMYLSACHRDEIISSWWTYAIAETKSGKPGITIIISPDIEDRPPAKYSNTNHRHKHLKL